MLCGRSRLPVAEKWAASQVLAAQLTLKEKCDGSDDGNTDDSSSARDLWFPGIDQEAV
jgi:hypothetical protein